ncbi:MAG: LytTR family transcriptional regulator DNA-binding domain-containing protein [Flavobacteriaceae bacterium]
MKKILILPYRLDVKRKDLEYLSEGIVEELIQLISTNSNLKTTSRSTSLYLLKNPLPPVDMKERYGIDYFIEGSIKYKENKYQVATRLFKTDNEALLLHDQSYFKLDKWTQPLNKLASEIIRTIDDVAASLPQQPNIDDSKARELYLRGIYHWHRYTHAEMLLAISFFKKSIKENESFAISHAALADCYSVIGAMGYEEPIRAFKLAKTHVNKALLLNDKRSDSYVSAAFVNIYYKRNLIQAKTNLVQALNLNTENVKAHHVFAMYYIHKGDFMNAEKHSAMTITLDPLALPHYSMIIRIQIYLKKYQQALDYIDAAILIDSQFENDLKEYRAYANLFLGNLESSIEDFKNGVERNNNNAMAKAHLSYAYSKANFHQESRNLEQAIYDLDIKNDTGVIAYALAIVKIGQSDYKAFFKYSEKAVQLGIGIFPAELKCNPIFAEVREDARFQKILKQCNLSDEIATFQKNRKPASIINIKSNTSVTLAIDPQDISYVEASDNYCTVYWYDSGILKNTILRQTLKNIEEQLVPFKNIVRCHKTFMINLYQELKITGNARAYFLESRSLPVRIPISRSKSKSIVLLLNKYQV